MKNFRKLTTTLLAATCIILSGCSSPTPDEKLAEAATLYQNRDTSRAILKLADISKNHADDPAAHEANLILAQHYAGIGNADKCIEYLDKVIDATEFTTLPNDTALDGKMAILTQVGDLEKVEEILLGLIEKSKAELPEREFDYIIDLAQHYLFWPDNEEKNQEGHDLLETPMLEDEKESLRGVARERLADFYRKTGQFEKSNAVYISYLEKFPEDSIATQLKFAMAVNTYQSGDIEKALEEAVNVEKEILGEIELKEDGADKAALYRVLAINYQALEDYETAEKYFTNAMGQIPMSQEAIRMQFQIAEMYISGGLKSESDETFSKGIEILEQIISENPGTNIALTAEGQITQANQVLDQYRIQKAEYERYLAEQEKANEAAGEGSEEATEEGTDEPALEQAIWYNEDGDEASDETATESEEVKEVEE